MRASFVLPGGVGFCNAVRRSLLSDIKSESPFEVEVRTNSSCQTDEFLAHRIGLIPFKRVGNGDTVDLKVKGKPAMSSDFVGEAFEACEEVEVMRLEGEQEIDLTVRFDEQVASKHARYSKCAGVGMHRVDGEGRHKITFETIDGSDPADKMRSALDALDARVQSALIDLANTDLPPPKTLC